MDPLAKPGFLTSEFWLIILFCVMASLKATVMPELSDEVFYLILSYVGVKGIQKGLAAAKGNGNGTKPVA